MSLININKSYFDKGVFVFENGDYIFIEEIQYSGDGIYWESEFEPLEHIDPRDFNQKLLGHKWRRVRHAGDDYFQKEMKIIPEDGKIPVFKVEDKVLYQKYIDEDDSEFKYLFDLSEVKGDRGDKGEIGTGFKIDSAGYINRRPHCHCNETQKVSSCSSCNPNVVSTSCNCSPGVGSTFLALGKSDGTSTIDGILSVDDFILNSAITGEKTWNFTGGGNSKVLKFTELEPDNLSIGTINVGNGSVSTATINISNFIPTSGYSISLKVKGVIVSTVNLTTGQLFDSAMQNLSNGVVGYDSSYSLGTGNITLSTISKTQSANGYDLSAAATFSITSTVGIFSGGLNVGELTIIDQLSKILQTPKLTGYTFTSISSGFRIAREYPQGAIDGNVLSIGTNIPYTHVVDTIGIEYIPGTYDVRTPEQPPTGTQVGIGVRGNIYICTKDGWILLSNMNTPDYRVAPNAAYVTTNQDGLYLINYVSEPFSVTGDDGNTISLDLGTNKLGVKVNSLSPRHLKDGSFIDGFDEGAIGASGVKEGSIKINVDDIDGFGLKTYSSITDGFKDLQVKSSDLAHDGLETFDDNINDLDGEDRIKLKVKASDLITPTTAISTGLQTSTDAGIIETDGFDNIYVKEGDAIKVDSDGVNVKSDELSLTSLNSTDVKVKPYVAANDGILATHLNPNAANVNKGLKVDNSTGIEILLSPDHKALKFDNNGILIQNEGITGWHLNSNVADSATGAIMFDTTSDTLKVKVKLAGGITLDADGLKIDTSDLSWLDSNVVKKVEVWDYDGINNLGDISGDLLLVGDKNNDTYMDIKLEVNGQKISIKPETNLGNLTTLINQLISNSQVEAHTHTISQVFNLQPELDLRVKEGQIYGGNFKIDTTNGMQLLAPDGTWRKLGIDDNGDIFSNPA